MKEKDGSPSRDYEVGYGKPPIKTRFVPGKSGNPRGRPKRTGKKNSADYVDEYRLARIILDESERKVRVSEGGKQVDISIIQAVLRSTFVKAAKGNVGASRLVLELHDKSSRMIEKVREDVVDIIHVYRHDRDFQELVSKECEKIGQPAANASDIVVDIDGFLGRVAPSGKRRQRRLSARIKTAIEENTSDLCQLKEWIADEELDPEIKRIVETDISKILTRIDILNRSIRLSEFASAVEIGSVISSRTNDDSR